MGSSAAASPVPLIRRARGCRLYDLRGARFLDLYRDGGGALLGHRAADSVTRMKSVLSQGLLSPVPSVWERRLVRVISSLFPDRIVTLFSSPARAREAVSRFLGVRVDASDVHDPAINDPPPVPPRAAFWRPFLPDAGMDGGAQVVLPLLPLTVCGAPSPVCFPEDPQDMDPFPDHVPGFVLAGALSALTRVQRSPKNQLVVDAGILRAVDSAAGWARRGPYVRATFAQSEYPRIVIEFLRAGVLLSPVYPGPSILPGECSPGEKRLLMDLFTSIPGG
ncbi:MAG TPA: hypothetical protein VMU36_13875 [Spirochaetia bacterium]|nr:hypothetical protein [Spirochaetia bacterium]